MIAVTCQGSYLISACSLICIIIAELREPGKKGTEIFVLQTDPRFFVTGTGYACLCSDKNTGGAQWTVPVFHLNDVRSSVSVF